MASRLDRIFDAYPLPALNLADKAVLWNLLNLNYSMMLASEPLLEIGAVKADGRLRAYYVEHREEERGHVAWLHADLKRLGKAPVPDVAGAMIAGTQYWLLEHDRPSALLGYIATLECRPFALDMVVAVEDAHGPVKTISHHAEHDIEHGRAVRLELDALNETDQESACRSAEWSASMIKWALERFM